MRFFLLLLALMVSVFLLIRPRPEVVETEASGVTQVSAGGNTTAPSYGMTAAQREYFLRQMRDLDTYLPFTMAEHDSMLIRWPEREDRPLRVFIEIGQVEGYNERIRRSVVDAFGRWQRVPEIPVDFLFTRTRSEADVTVKWLRTFNVQRAGQADVVWSQPDGWLQSGTLTLATFSFDGFQLPPEAIFTVALHEIGHLLGLRHSDQPGDVMFPTTGVHDLTARDRRTAMLLYSVPPGSLKGGA